MWTHTDNADRHQVKGEFKKQAFSSKSIRDQEKPHPYSHGFTKQFLKNKTKLGFISTEFSNVLRFYHPEYFR